MSDDDSTAKPKRPRGFATWDADKRRAVAQLAGKASHASGKGHTFTKEEAADAGRKGGLVTASRVAERKARSEEALAADAKEAGRKGGLASAAARRRSEPEPGDDAT